MQQRSPGWAIQQDQVVVGGNRDQRFGQGVQGCVGFAAGARIQDGLEVFGLLSPWQHVKVLADADDRLNGLAGGDGHVQSSATIVVVGSGVTEVVSDIALRVEVDDQHAVAGGSS